MDELPPGVSYMTRYRWIRAGYLKATRASRYPGHKVPPRSGAVLVLDEGEQRVMAVMAQLTGAGLTVAKAAQAARALVFRDNPGEYPSFDLAPGISLVLGPLPAETWKIVVPGSGVVTELASRESVLRYLETEWGGNCSKALVREPAGGAIWAVRQGIACPLLVPPDPGQALAALRELARD